MNADSTVQEEDPIRCRQAQRLSDNTVVLGHELMLAAGQRNASIVLSRMVKMEPTVAIPAFRNVGLSDGGTGLAFGDSFADQDPATMMAAPVGIDDQEDVVMAEAAHEAAADAIPSQDGSSDVEVVAASFLGALSSQEEATRVAAELAAAELPDFGGGSAPTSPRLDLAPTGDRVTRARRFPRKRGHGASRGIARRFVP